MRERIVERINDSGPMPFDEYMDLCLYAPDAGFFSAGSVRPGVGGDFVTSPEVSPWFGRLVGRWVESLGWVPDHIVEIGAGSGSLVTPLIDEIGGDGPSFHVVEMSADARAALAALDGVSVLDSTDEPPEGDTVVVMNEVLDNVPTKLVEVTPDGWDEVVVDVEGGALRFASSPASAEMSAWCNTWLGDAPSGARLAAPQQAIAMLKSLIQRPGRTRVCAIDYAADTKELAQRPSASVVRTFRGHREGADPLTDPGATDVTVEVNSDVIRRLASNEGASLETVTQGEFLRRFGADEVLADLNEASFAAARRGDVMEQLRLKSEATGLRALLNPTGLGGFMVFDIESGT